MRRYIFSVDKVVFVPSSQHIAYDDIQHKNISEKAKEFLIKVLADDLAVAEKKMFSALKDFIIFNFGDINNVTDYKFIPILIEVEEISFENN